MIMHHYSMNHALFQKYLRHTPTLINVIRNPIDFFQSKYYFRRMGRESTGKDGKKSMNSFSERDRNMTIDQCVEEKHSECKS